MFMNLVPLVPTITTAGHMWGDGESVSWKNVDENRRLHTITLFSRAKIDENIGNTWKDIASILFRIRCDRPKTEDRGLPLPVWIQAYYSGGRSDFFDETSGYPSLVIRDPIIVNKKYFNRIMRYI